MDDELPYDLDISNLMLAGWRGCRTPSGCSGSGADRWIGYPRAVEARPRLEALHGWPTKQRMPNLLLVGPTNNGKSMIIEKFRRQPRVSGAPTRRIPVLAVQMPSDPSVPRFYASLLAALGAPLRPGGAGSQSPSRFGPLLDPTARSRFRDRMSSRRPRSSVGAAPACWPLASGTRSPQTVPKSGVPVFQHQGRRWSADLSLAESTGRRASGRC